MGLYATLFTNSDGKIVIWQTPNLPLIGWALFTALTHIVPAGQWLFAVQYISFGFIFTWAWLEITEGDSYFRQILGALVLAASIHSRLR